MVYGVPSVEINGSSTWWTVRCALWCLLCWCVYVNSFLCFMEFAVLMYVGKQFPVLYGVCSADGQTRTVQCVWFSWFTADSHWTCHHLSVCLLPLQRGLLRPPTRLCFWLNVSVGWFICQQDDSESYGWIFLKLLKIVGRKTKQSLDIGVAWVGNYRSRNLFILFNTVK